MLCLSVFELYSRWVPLILGIICGLRIICGTVQIKLRRSHVNCSKISLSLACKIRNICIFCYKKWNYSLIYAATLCNLQQPDLLHLYLVKRATLLFYSFCSNVASF